MVPGMSMAFRGVIVRGGGRYACGMRAALFLLALAAVLAMPGCDRPPAPAGHASGGSHGAPGSEAFAARCAALPPALPEVAADPIAPQFDESRSLAELTAMYERATAHHETLGLTHAQLGYASALAANGFQDGGRACLRVQVRVQVSLAPVTVFIARELAADPCHREAVREHELRHVDVHAEFLREAPARLLALLAAADVGRVRHGTDPEAIQQEAAREVRDIVAQAETTDRDTLAAMQAAIDTPEEYERVSPPGRPKGERTPEHDSAEGNPLGPPGRPKGEQAPEHDSAEGRPLSPSSRPKGEQAPQRAGAKASVMRGLCDTAVVAMPADGLRVRSDRR